MAIGAADIHKAVQTAWTDQGVDYNFKKYWASASRTEYPSLHDQEATPTQPFPYCVFNQGPSLVEARMSGHSIDEKHEVRSVPWDFQIYAKEFGTQSAKTVAVALAEVVLQKFGGHPTIAPVEMTLDTGYLLLFQYLNEFPTREGDDEYSWTISYSIQVDVPVKVLVV